MGANATASSPVDGSDLTAGITKRVGQLLIQALVLAVLLFLSAGRLDWLWGWVYLATFVLGVAINGAILWRKNPSLIAERAKGAQADTKGWDKVLTLAYGLLASLGLQLVAGLDQRFGWTPPLPQWLHLAGLGLSLLGYAFASWGMVENAYFATTVRIQEERGHSVCTTGPYRYVRHPGYAGWGLGFLSVPLLLGSLWALVPGVLAILLLVVRTALEDRTLQQGLPGYAEYARQTRYRLVPGVW